MIAKEIEQLLREPEEFISRLRILNQNNSLSYLFPFWYEQKQWLDALLSGKRYIFGLKPRQVGFTTTTAAYLFWLLYTGRDPAICLQMVHEQDAQTRLAEMMRVYHATLPRELRSSLRVNNNKRMQFGHNGAQFMRIVAGGRGQARAWTANHLHATEMSKWPRGTAANADESGAGSADEEAFASAMATMHDEGRRIIVESTGNGPFGLFYTLFEQAKVDPDWAYVFVPWQAVPRYQAAVADPQRFEESLTDEERKIQHDYRLSLEQLAWRRNKIRSEKFSLMRFRREFPMDDTEPFMLAEQGWFAQRPLKRQLDLVNAKDLGAPKDPFRVFRACEPNRRYGVGADTCGGTGNDEASVDVTRDDGLHCAKWTSKHASPYEQAQWISRISGLYKKPWVLVESNNHGAIVIRELEKMGGVRLWKTDDDKYFSSQGATAGDSKRDLMAHAREIIDHDHCIINDAETIRQAMKVVEKANGKIEGSGRSHDDRIMSYCLSLWAIRRFHAATDDLVNERAEKARLAAVQRSMRRFERE